MRYKFVKTKSNFILDSGGVWCYNSSTKKGKKLMETIFYTLGTIALVIYILDSMKKV